MARSNEPVIWGAFAAGGMAAAMLMPVHALVLGILAPLGVVSFLDYEQARALFAHPIAKLYMFVLITLPLAHAAHRLRFALADLGLRGLGPALAAVCYGGMGIGIAAGLAAIYAL
jgi:fumarate reductase subunit D